MLYREPTPFDMQTSFTEVRQCRSMMRTVAELLSMIPAARSQRSHPLRCRNASPVPGFHPPFGYGGRSGAEIEARFYLAVLIGRDLRPSSRSVISGIVASEREGGKPPARRSTKSQGIAALPIGTRSGLRHHSGTANE